jgi:hypothetical protein
MFVPHRKHTPQLPVAGIALLLLYIYMMFVPHRKHTPQLPVTGIALLLLYIDDVRTSQEAYASTARYRDSFTSFIYR